MLGLMAALSNQIRYLRSTPIYGIGIPLTNSQIFVQANRIGAELPGDPNQAGLIQRQPHRRVPRLWQVCLTLRKLLWTHGNRTTLRPLCGHTAAGIRTMLQIDPWVKAAECERAIRVVADPERRSVLISLQSLWISLGNEEAILDGSRQAGHVPKIAQIHAELMSLYRNAMN
jgi:hypothetical protein